MEHLIAWLEKEAATIADFGDAYNAGYQDALTNTLDYILGAQVFIESEETK